MPKPAKPITLADLKSDPTNRRQRTARSAKMLVESLEHLGAARSIVIDEDNEILAGNGVVEAAEEAGITNLQIVETDGTTLVAVRRTGLSADEKRALALYDNRTGELSEWIPERLAKDQADGQLLTPWFSEVEMRKLMKASGGTASTMREVDTSPVNDRFWIAVRGPLKLQGPALKRLRELLKEYDGLDIELGLTPDTEAWTG